MKKKKTLGVIQHSTRRSKLFVVNPMEGDRKEKVETGRGLTSQILLLLYTGGPQGLLGDEERSSIRSRAFRDEFTGTGGFGRVQRKAEGRRVLT